MLVRITRDCLVGTRVHAQGAVVEVPDEIAQRLIHEGAAVATTEVPPIPPIPPAPKAKPETATVKPPETTAQRT